MTTAAIRAKLVSYLQTADEQKLKAIYTMVADDIGSSEHELPENFRKELDRRRKTFLSGQAQIHTWEETKKEALNRIKKATK